MSDEENDFGEFTVYGEFGTSKKFHSRKSAERFAKGTNRIVIMTKRNKRKIRRTIALKNKR